MSDIVGLLSTIVLFGIVLFLIGFVTTKGLFWAAAATVTLWAGAPLVGSYSRAEVLAEMVPHLRGLVLFYPTTVVPETFTHLGAVGGILGDVIAVALIVAGVLPYSLGVWLGLIAWPELLLLRIIL